MKNFTWQWALPALLFLLAPAGAALAQSGTPPTGGPTPTSVPIDGGAALLLAGGVAVGLKRLRARRRA